MDRFDAAERVLSPPRFLAELRLRGVGRLRRVAFRPNRSTIWSLTQRGTVLNVHEAFRSAPDELLDAFATVAREGGVGSPESRRASERIVAWPGLQEALRTLRAEHDEEAVTAACCATPAQRSYLTAVYSYLNATRFSGALPADIPVRLSHRMKSRLGHMLPAGDDEDRRVTEIALNVDLMLEGNGAERMDTLLHEMAHVADYLESGHRGHGRSWKEWAVRVGCKPSTLYDRPVRTRSLGEAPTRRVPPLPEAIRAMVRG